MTYAILASPVSISLLLYPFSIHSQFSDRPMCQHYNAFNKNPISVLIKQDGTLPNPQSFQVGLNSLFNSKLIR